MIIFMISFYKKKITNIFILIADFRLVVAAENARISEFNSVVHVPASDVDAYAQQPAGERFESNAAAECTTNDHA